MRPIKGNQAESKPLLAGVFAFQTPEKLVLGMVHLRTKAI
jgi:hypothetical protein